MAGNGQGSPDDRLRIEIRAGTDDDLFHPLDPAPLPGRELDPDVAAYIADRLAAVRAPRRARFAVVVHLEAGRGADAAGHLEAALRAAFESRARLKHEEFRRLLRGGRRSLVAGLAFIALLLAIVLAIWRTPQDVPLVLAGTLSIIVWVVLWRAFDTFLYDWWPIRTEERLWRKLGAAPVDVRRRASA